MAEVCRIADDKEMIGGDAAPGSAPKWRPASTTVTAANAEQAVSEQRAAARAVWAARRRANNRVIRDAIASKNF